MIISSRSTQSQDGSEPTFKGSDRPYNELWSGSCGDTGCQGRRSNVRSCTRQMSDYMTKTRSGPLPRKVLSALRCLVGQSISFPYFCSWRCSRHILGLAPKSSLHFVRLSHHSHPVPAPFPSSFDWLGSIDSEPTAPRSLRCSKR